MTIQQAILATVLYFDAMDYPLTFVELSKWLWIGSLRDQSRDELGTLDSGSRPGMTKTIIDALNDLIHQGRLETRDGFFFVSGRVAIIDTRLERYRWAISKLVRARRILWWISLLPFVRGIAIVNTLGFLHSRKNGDIDCLIIVRHGFLWSCRLLTTGIIAALGLRPREHQGAGALCFSFYVSDTEMNLKSIALEDNQPTLSPDSHLHTFDPYLVYWISSAIPFYDSSIVFKRFHESNQWIGSFIADANGRAEHPQWCIRDQGIRRVLVFFRSIAEQLLSLCSFERFARWFQYRRLPDHLKSTASDSSSGVVMNDHMLKFHHPDKRDEIRGKWLEELTNL